VRVVIDTNVLVSGIINPHGPPGRIIDAVIAERLIVLYDDRILGEYRAVLRRPVFGFSRTDVDALLEFIERSGQAVSAEALSLLLPDASDLPFVEVAISGQADALITGNSKHYKPKRGALEMNVVAPSDFLKELSGGDA
jgi:uncharacterized protein